MWAFATRNRVENCKRFIDAWHQTQANSPVYVRLDNDDPAIDHMQSLPWPDTFEITIGPRARIAMTMREMFAKYPNEPWYGVMADDVIPKTLHWDQKLIEAAGTHSISCGNEVHEKNVRMCHPCVGGDLVRLVGFFAMPDVEHFGTDTFWECVHHCCDLNNRQNEVILEHAHFNFDQSKLDQTYIDSQSIRQRDKRAYKEWMNKNFDQILDKLNQAYGWRKVRERSGWV